MNSYKNNKLQFTKNLLAIVALGVALCCLNVSQSYAASCPQLPIKPEITYAFSFGKLGYEYNTSMKQLSSMGNIKGSSGLDFSAAGLAVAPFYIEVKFAIVSYTDGKGGACAAPAKALVSMGYRSPKIFVAREFEKGGCEFSRILRHEKAHQAINKTSLEFYNPLFKKAAEQIITAIKPVQIGRMSRGQSAAKDMTGVFMNKMESLVDLFHKRRDAEHGKLDNSVNYTLENLVCH